MACFLTKAERPPLLPGQCAEWSQIGEAVTVIANDGVKVTIRDRHGLEHRVDDCKLSWVPSLMEIDAARMKLDDKRRSDLKTAVGPKKTAGSIKVIKVPRDLLEGIEE